MPMKNPPHPGLSLRHDCLEPLSLSVTDAAKKLGVSRKQLSDLSTVIWVSRPRWRSASTRPSAAALIRGCAFRPPTTWRKP